MGSADGRGARGGADGERGQNAAGGVGGAGQRPGAGGEAENCIDAVPAELVFETDRQSHPGFVRCLNRGLIPESTLGRLV